ncbi:hypothetical protein FOZ62_014186, partial [Perkinsus olseni]
MTVANRNRGRAGSVDSLTSSAESVSYAAQKYRSDRSAAGYMSFEMKGLDDDDEDDQKQDTHNGTDNTEATGSRKTSGQSWSAARRRSAVVAIPQPPTFYNPPPRLVSLTAVDRTNPV